MNLVLSHKSVGLVFFKYAHKVVVLHEVLMFDVITVHGNFCY